MDWKIFRSTFDQNLQDFLEKKIADIQPHLHDKILYEILSYITSFAKGGKRIRPYMLFLRYHACGGSDTVKVRQLSLTSELIHLFALIHDDIVDEGTLRHDIPTYHKHLGHWYNNEYAGLSQALLMGDLVYTRALENFYQRQHSHNVNEQIRKLLKEVIFGEIIDVHLSHTPFVSDNGLIAQKDKLKSGNYTFTRPMLLGATLAGKKDTTAIERLGEGLGVAFQMRDDLLDIIDPQTNKTPFSDHQEGNQTYILHHALQHANTVDRDYLVATRGKKLDESARKKLLAIFERTGTIQFAKQEVNTLLDTSKRQFHDVFPTSNQRTEQIASVIQFLYV